MIVDLACGRHLASPAFGFAVIRLSFGFAGIWLRRHSVVIRPSAVIDCHSIVIGYWLFVMCDIQ